ncbi:SDR family oxidoreductase [Myxococcota bacterium]|nr:SDR family oxidoreductase [Myxococcota bacterium]
MSLVSMLKGRGPSGFGYGSTAEDVTAKFDLRGRTYLVTGATSGLGLETVRVLALRGARVIAAGRSVEKVVATCGALGKNVEPLACELSDPTSIRGAVAALKAGRVKLDGILCNAGIMALPKLETRFGVELQLFTNHVGHFILVTGLLDALTDDGRVVMTSSDAHKAAPKEGIQLDNLSGENGYSPWAAYGQSKLANILFTKELARRLEGTSKTANALHPGVIATQLSRSMGKFAQVTLDLVSPLFLKSVGQGAATQVFVATHPSVQKISGEYFADCNVAKPSAKARDLDLARRLWDTTEVIVQRLP